MKAWPTMVARVGNAPVSFGVFEAAMGAQPALPYAEVLAAIAEAGYEGTELGPYGYLPTDADELAQALRRVGLRLASSFVPLALADPQARESGIEQVLQVARLLATQDVEEVIVADALDEGRAAQAGRTGAGWDEASWAVAVATLGAIAQTLREELGMRVVVHHHAGSHIETPAEVERLLATTQPADVGLLLDTGHYVYGGGDPIELLAHRGDRVRYLHFKDVDAARLAQARARGLDLRAAWRQGVFVPLGQGAVDLRRIVAWMRETGWRGWVIVEQDIVPDAQGRLGPDPYRCARESRAWLRSLGL